MVKKGGHYCEIAEMAGVEVVEKTPGPYSPALTARVPPFPPAIARKGPILVSRTSSRGVHDIPVQGEDVGILGWREFRDLVSTASVMIGPNSGAVHFAALFGCRTIVFDEFHTHSIVAEGAGHWFTWSEAGLHSVLNSL